MEKRSWQFRSLVATSAAAVSAAAVLGVTMSEGGVGAAGARQASSTPLATQSQGASPLLLGNRATEYVGEAFDVGQNVPVPSGGTTTDIDPATKLKCPSGKTCIIVRTITVVVDDGAVDHNAAFLNWQINGAEAGHAIEYLGDIPSDGSTLATTMTDVQSGVTGKVTVQSSIGATAHDATLADWTVSYAVYY